MRRLLFSLTALCALAWAGAAQAGTFALTGEDLSYVAPSGETNRVFLIHEEKPVRGFRLIDTGAPVTAGASCSSVGPNEAFCPTPDSVDHVLVSVDDGDDYVNTSASSSSLTRLEGGNGNDALYPGSNSSATLDGGPGADVLSGEGATVDYSARTNPLTVTLGDGLANDGEAGENDLIANNVRSVLGGSGADTYTLTGSDALRLVDAGAGIDHLVAIGSNCGLFGGPGNDQIEADHSHCGLRGGGDNDTIVGGDGRQFLDGGEGNDVLRAGPGRDIIAGERGADEIIGGKGRDHARGGSGDDTFRMKDGLDDFIDGNQGIDRARVDKVLDELHDIEHLF
jgi:Ca2+-binding RTX toxin-like protein